MGKSLVTELPVTMDIFDQELTDFLKGETPIVQLPCVPCHEKAAEHYIKIVTEACNAVCGENKRDGFV